jgi:hypothetical protein
LARRHASCPQVGELSLKQRTSRVNGSWSE